MLISKKIAVIGQGFVGGSLTTVFAERGFDVLVHDKTGKVCTGGKQPTTPEGLHPANVNEFVKSCETSEDFSKVYFVCLPTPMYDDGSADLSIVEGVLSQLATLPGERIAVVKSTVPPGSTERWNKMFSEKGLHVIFNPEFLTEANALDDMRNQNRIILGGPRPWINTVKQVFQTAFSKVPLIKTSSTTAEMVKYVTNNFLTVKVAFANEMFQVCEALDKSGLNVDYDKVIEYAKYDSRLGSSHWSVPGPDGHFGYGGSCFVKDLNAMASIANDLKIETPVLDGAWKKNLEVRPERDWESLIGRAVSKKPKG
jgi:UDPglucose 6-dehydrogenase